ncbi:Uncharacterised protein [uncultured archaeon]|nr:Uncharacterised protein [uncultured archaeon]
MVKNENLLKRISSSIWGIITLLGSFLAFISIYPNIKISIIEILTLTGILLFIVFIVLIATHISHLEEKINKLENILNIENRFTKIENRLGIQ